jgi:hypothetical protein
VPITTAKFAKFVPVKSGTLDGLNSVKFRTVKAPGPPGSTTDAEIDALKNPAVEKVTVYELGPFNVVLLHDGNPGPSQIVSDAKPVVDNDGLSISGLGIVVGDANAPIVANASAATPAVINSLSLNICALLISWIHKGRSDANR